jgi:hypothetical protein
MMVNLLEPPKLISILSDGPSSAAIHCADKAINDILQNNCLIKLFITFS